MAVHPVPFRLSETFHLLRVGCREQHVCSTVPVWLRGRIARRLKGAAEKNAPTRVVVQWNTRRKWSRSCLKCPTGCTETTCRLEGADVASHPVPFHLGETFHLLRVECGK